MIRVPSGLGGQRSALWYGCRCEASEMTRNSVPDVAEAEHGIRTIFD
jgi:hypothetical protein